MKRNDIINKAKSCKTNVEKNQKLAVSNDMAYYFCKVILGAKDTVKDLKIKAPSSPTGDTISRQFKKDDYVSGARKLVEYIELHKQMPNYLTIGKLKLEHKLYTYLYASALITSHTTGKLPSQVNVSSKLFVKEETSDDIYDYFCKVFNVKPKTVDEILAVMNGKEYAYYYDDKYTNRVCVVRIKNRQGINCTDSCQLVMAMLKTIIKRFGTYKNVECLHVMCQSGGHVKLRITLKDGTKIIRDPACALSNNGQGYKCNWCTNTPIAINPQWFMANLYK